MWSWQRRIQRVNRAPCPANSEQVFHQMCSFKLKMHKNSFWPGLWLRCSPTPSNQLGRRSPSHLLSPRSPQRLTSWPIQIPGCTTAACSLLTDNFLSTALSLTHWMIWSDIVCVHVFAGHRLMTLMDLEPDNEKIYFNLGLLSMDDKKFDQAKAWFDKAIKVLLGILNMFLSLASPKSWLFRWINSLFFFLRNITTIRTLFHKRGRTNWSAYS